jgi:hypothetical protein
LQGKPNTHAWNTNRAFRSNRFPHIPGYGSGPPKATAGPYAHQLCVKKQEFELMVKMGKLIWKFENLFFGNEIPKKWLNK